MTLSSTCSIELLGVASVNTHRIERSFKAIKSIMGHFTHLVYTFTQIVMGIQFAFDTGNQNSSVDIYLPEKMQFMIVQTLLRVPEPKSFYPTMVTSIIIIIYSRNDIRVIRYLVGSQEETLNLTLYCTLPPPLCFLPFFQKIFRQHISKNS